MICAAGRSVGVGTESPEAGRSGGVLPDDGPS